MLAVCVTIAIHMLLTAIVIHDWRRPERAAAPDDVIVMTLLPPPADEPAERAERGIVAADTPPRPAPAERPAPIVALPEVPAEVAAQPVAEPPADADSGRDERLARTAQTYQRAVLARINAERRYPRGALLDGFEGSGTILFTIARDGQLLDSTIAMTTGRRALDRATLSLVRRAAPFPAIPPELPDELAVTMPIRFLILEPNPKVATQ